MFLWIRIFNIDQRFKIFNICLIKKITQQDPQEPWSRISLRVGHMGQAVLPSNSLGSAWRSSSG